ncbi:S-adenosyl-L-methionine-dependent methyltransferase [Mycena alexandri]|uniref:phosphoethanolamine N-methyltransferase n=1 Tax=Mycena alexandri TaxID=1745969 RepID=A0AAD6T1S8_9AGAR|nr:S-adenosyl-L-methionine-dependent methyltransferase [Mycena alexandri]
MFFSDHHTKFTKRIHAPPQAVLDVLRDPHAMMGLSPLIISVTVDPQDSTKYTVIDRLAMPFGTTRMISYGATIVVTAEGMDAESKAGAGTTTRSRYVARAISERETEVEEQVHVTAFFLLLPFIKGVIASAHNLTLDRLAAKAEGSCKRPAGYLYLDTLVLFLRKQMNLLSVLPAVLALIAVYWMAKRSSADPYGDFHLALNKLPGEDTPRTEWLNMGYWKVPLALKLLQAAGCKPGGRVLDVGHGSGESLILLLTHPDVPRPAHLTGITSLESHYTRSQARVARLNQTVPVDLYAGDAIYRPGSRNHPIDPSSEQPKFDTILALDCAYHFQPRAEFLRQAYDRLNPGGSIALADICFAPGALQTRWTRFVTMILRLGLMPAENMISTDEYLAQMRQVGFIDVQLEDITEDVFPKFISFLATQGVGWWIFSRVFNIFWGSGARFVLVSALLRH